MKKLLVLVCCLPICSPSILFADTGMEQILKTIISPSPQTAGFMRYGEYPVGLATGVPSISVPLYTISCDGLEIPISISYHASGIKVEDVASAVGLGWTLSSPGVISRTVCSYGDNGNYVFEDDTDSYINSVSCFELASIISGKNGYDTESDKYYYQFADKQGSFRQVLSDFSYVTIPYNPIRIEKIADDFKITDTNGAVYIFSIKETSGVPGNSHYTAWYLSKIITPTLKEEIDFEYETTVYSKGTVSEYYHEGVVTEWKCPLGIINEVDSYQHEDQIIRSSYDYHTPLLKKIIWRGGTVSLSYTEDRYEQNLDTKRLSTLTVKNRSNTTVAAYRFIAKALGTGNNARTLLDKLQVLDKFMNAQQCFSFTYDERPLPDYFHNFGAHERAYCTSDYWGYYNGSMSDHFIPDVYLPSNYIHGATRTPNPYMAQCGILRTITYPTGGQTAFEYEGNTINGTTPWGGLRIKAITNQNEHGITQVTRYSYGPGIASQPVESNLFRYQIAYVYCYRYSETAPLLTSDNNIHTVCLSSPILPLTGWSGNPVFYPHITKQVFDASNRLVSFTDYTYSEDKDEVGEVNEEDMYPLIYSELYNYDQGTTTPLLISQYDYRVENQDTILEKIISNHYELVTRNHPVVGVHVSNSKVYNASFEQGPYAPYASRADYVGNFRFHHVLAIPDYRRLDFSDISFPQEETSQRKLYNYDRFGRTLLPIEESVIQSGDTIKNKYWHPFDIILEMGMQPLIDQNRNDLVIGQTHYYNGQRASSNWDEYRIENGLVLLSQKRDTIGSDAQGVRLRINSYDEFSNIQELVQDENQRVILVWDPSNRLPIAKIECGNNPHIMNALRGDIHRLHTSSRPENVLESFRERVESLGGKITTYKYEPLVGLTEIVDPRGNKETFEYDDMQRLMLKKNAKGQITEENQYHYTN